jgi:CheY-like chemotaxis protein
MKTMSLMLPKENMEIPLPLVAFTPIGEDHNNEPLPHVVIAANQNKDVHPYEILLVEDSVADALLTKKALDHLGLGYRLTYLSKGSEVMPYLLSRKDKKPDLMILDLGLPDISGFDIMDELAEMPASIRDVPIVIVTGYDDFGYIRQNDRLLIRDYVYKSSLRLTIHKSIRQALNG